MCIVLLVSIADELTSLRDVVYTGKNDLLNPRDTAGCMADGTPNVLLMTVDCFHYD